MSRERRLCCGEGSMFVCVRVCVCVCMCVGVRVWVVDVFPVEFLVEVPDQSESVPYILT